MNPDSPPDRYAVIGHPVAHSRSPFIHAAFAQQTGQRLVYTRIDSPPDALAARLNQFAQDGGVGCNITVPFKFEAHALCRATSARAALAGAVNVMRLESGGWWGDNTDGIGLVRDIETHAATPLRGARVLLVGAGGAAAGVLGPLLGAGCAELQIVNRNADRAQALAHSHRSLAAAHGVQLHAAALTQAGTGFDVVINASASSLAGDAVPVSPRVLAAGALAVDLMYGPAAQGFIDWAVEHGARGRDGLGMLVEQAAEAFFLWRGVHPETAPVLAALRAALQAAGDAQPPNALLAIGNAP